MTKIKLKKQTKLSKLGDFLMLPVMYFLQWTFSEVPQRTHRWNNTKLPATAIVDFKSEDTVTVSGDKDAKRRWFGPFPLFHMPLFGGWDEFVVLAPKELQTEWYIGWLPFDTIGVSQIPLKGSVRVLVGPKQVQFFGVDADGSQISVEVVGKGVVGKAGQFKKVPLL